MASEFASAFDKATADKCATPDKTADKSAFAKATADKFWKDLL
jgi:hypothetical protein